MSARKPSPEPYLRDANPGVQAGETALRVGAGRHTVDIVSTAEGFLALAGDGVGRPPAAAEITPGAVPVFLLVANFVDERTAWETSAWPLAARGDQEGTADV